MDPIPILIEPIKTVPCNALNFCKFDAFYHQSQTKIALPNLINSNLVDIYNLDTDSYMSEAIGLNQSNSTGICMNLSFYEQNTTLLLAIGYEDGSISIWNTNTNSFIYRSQLFQQPGKSH
jgi:WD40 repeat protein